MNKIKATLALFACLWFISCAGKDSSEQEIRPAAPERTAGASPELAALLPTVSEVPGWLMSQEPRSFNPDNLWEFIDGAADRYLAYGFERAITAGYVREGTDYRVLIDIYRMKDPLNAFGIYAQERNPEYQFLEIGNEGYLTGTTLNFWTGPFYVKITTFEEKDTVKREMSKLARAVASKVTDRGSEPPEASYFPEDNQLPRTLVYIPRDVLAQSYLTNGFEVKYREGGGEYRMILVILDHAEAARDALARYGNFLSNGGRPVQDLAAPGQGGFVGTDSYYGNAVAVRSGRHIAITLGRVSEDEGKELLAELLENIRQPAPGGPVR